MTTEPTSALLRRAAKTLRDASNRMPSGPWRHEKGGESNCGDGCCYDWWNDRVWSADEYMIQEFDDPNAARWFTLMQPSVALAMADMLDDAADECENDPTYWRDFCYTAPTLERVARAVLREPDEEVGA